MVLNAYHLFHITTKTFMIEHIVLLRILIALAKLKFQALYLSYLLSYYANE